MTHVLVALPRAIFSEVWSKIRHAVGQALSVAARFVRFVKESACYFKATLKNRLLVYITTKPARLDRNTVW